MFRCGSKRQRYIQADGIVATSGYALVQSRANQGHPLGFYLFS